MTETDKAPIEEARARRKQPITLGGYDEIWHGANMARYNGAINKIKSLMDDMLTCDTERQLFYRSSGAAKALQSLARIVEDSFERRAREKDVSLNVLTVAKVELEERWVDDD